MVREAVNDLVEEVPPLVADQLDRIPKTAPDVFVEELGHRGRCIVQCRFRLHPLCIVLRSHEDILVPCTCHDWSEWVDEIEPPFLE